MRPASAFFAVVLTFATLPAAHADTQKNVGRYGGWSVWTYATADRKGCFIYANPAKASPKSLDHGLVSFFMRNTTKRTDVRAEASLQLGYEQAKQANGTLKIDDKTFQLLSEGKEAWLARARDGELLDAMKGGRSMTVQTMSTRGNATTYVFPLAGVTQAMQTLRKYCPRAK